MEIEVEVLVVDRVNASPRHLSEDSRVGRNAPAAHWHGDKMSEHRIRGAESVSNMSQGGHVLQQRDRRAQLGGEQSEVVVLWCCGVVP